MLKFRTIGLMTLILLLLSTSALVYARNVGQGRTLYSEHCLRCHGFEGRGGQMPGTPNFSRGEGLRMTDVELKERIQAGKMACPSYRGILSERDTLDIVSYLRTLY